MGGVSKDAPDSAMRLATAESSKTGECRKLRWGMLPPSALRYNHAGPAERTGHIHPHERVVGKGGAPNLGVPPSLDAATEA